MKYLVNDAGIFTDIAASQPTKRGVVLHMIAMTSEKYKIFYSIVGRIFVDMMHNFLWLQVSSKMFLHNEARLKNSFSIVRERMVFDTNLYISHSIVCTTFVINGMSVLKVTLKSCAHFLLPFLRKFLPFIWCNIICKEFLKTIACNLSMVFSSWVDSCWHKSFQIKNAIFGGLKETVKFPHLDGIVNAIKNTVPSSEFSISNMGALSNGY